VYARRSLPLHVEHVLPAGVDDVHAVLTDRDFLREYGYKTEAQEVRVVVAADRDRAVLRRVMPTAAVPPFLRGFVTDTVDVSEVTCWSGTADGGRVGDIHLRALVPAREAWFSGRVGLTREEGGRCRWVVDGTVWVEVPLISGKLAPFLAHVLEGALAVEADLAEQWLAR
jgi:hypothetical protein